MPKECMTSANGLRTIERIIGLLKQRPMTVAELHEEMKGSYSRIGAFVTYMRRHPQLHGPIYIESWHRRNEGSKGKSMARYRYGEGEDAPTPYNVRMQRLTSVPMTEEEEDALIEKRLREQARRRQAKYPIQRHWLIAALYGPAQGASNANQV